MKTYTFVNGAQIEESEIMAIINRCMKAHEYDPEKEAKKEAKKQAKRAAKKAQLEEDFQECIKFCQRVVMI